jgi:hypothetical protein
MKKLAFVVTALLGAAPLAQAQGWQNTYDHHDHDYDRRTDEGRRDQPRHHSVTLATMDISRKETVDVDRRQVWSNLRLVADRGVAYVDFVTIRFGNGEQEHVDINRRIGRGEVADIPVNGRHIEAITVHGRPDRWARIRVVGTL